MKVWIYSEESKHLTVHLEIMEESDNSETGSKKQRKIQKSLCMFLKEFICIVGLKHFLFSL